MIRDSENNATEVKVKFVEFWLDFVCVIAYLALGSAAAFLSYGEFYHHSTLLKKIRATMKYLRVYIRLYLHICTHLEMVLQILAHGREVSVGKGAVEPQG